MTARRGPLATICSVVLLLAACTGGPILANPPASLNPEPAAPPGPVAVSDPVPIRLPRDDAAHQRLTEWWYYTGNLRDATGRRFGFELTFFRVGIQPRLAGGSPWDIDDLYFAHFAATDTATGAYYHADRTGRAVLADAGAISGARDRAAHRQQADPPHRELHRPGEPAVHPDRGASLIAIAERR